MTDKDKRGRRWEMFCDDAYYHDWCVRCLDTAQAKHFNSELSFHFMTQDKSQQFYDLVMEAK